MGGFMSVLEMQLWLKQLKLLMKLKNVANSLEVERLYVDYLKEEIKLGTNYLS